MKKYYAGYNSYGINVVGYHAIHQFETAAERDAWVETVNSKYDQPRAESISASVAYRVMRCLRTGMYDLDGTMVVDNPNKR